MPVSMLTRAELAQNLADELVKMVGSIPDHLKNDVAKCILHKEHRTHQQSIFRKIIGPLVSTYADIPRSDARQFVDGRNEAAYNWSCKAVENNDPVFPYI